MKANDSGLARGVAAPVPLFTINYLRNQLKSVLDLGYRILTCDEYCQLPDKMNAGRVVVLRVDVDLSLLKARMVLGVLRDLGVPATFFIRLHALEYNPFSFENFRILRQMIVEGHEVGYHSEVLDQAFIWQDDPERCLVRDLRVMEAMLEVRVRGAASHGGMTGLNNLDFWNHRKPADFGLDYEGYDREPSFNLFWNSLYVSDSEWTRWKSYRNGQLLDGDRRSIEEHAAAGERLIYALIHPDTYFVHHRYEHEG
ncbi:MAG: hypothetical protein WKF55_13635 [Gemmatimonadaceae bacterium]